ncbi:MAG: phosphoribosylformylglycinamidine synthase, partial [Salinisphaera sp.]|nr:phosphoribosylformylglycinamidine synthase [Salinisphaera sp.]
MRIGLGGGAASSVASGASSEDLDLASVQRANPEMERLCQEVIDACWSLGEDNPIVSIHDVGAGGLSNALPEIIDNDGRGGQIQMSRIPRADTSLSPMELWCNEAQERYVVAVDPKHLMVFEALCARERCPYAVVGHATDETQLQVTGDGGDHSVDLPMAMLLGKLPAMQRSARSAVVVRGSALAADIDPRQAAYRVLRLPAVADKGFLVTIGDRSVGGMVAREQMVGPWQVPVADCAVTTSGFTGTQGEAMAMGERSPLALLDAPASGRMAVGEALTNLAAARVARLADVRLSANWMAACGDPEEDAQLYATVRAVGAELCPALGICIPVGKDSLSMRSQWRSGGEERQMRAPLSLIISAFAPVCDAGATLTPQLRLDRGATRLVLVDLGAGRNRLGGSALAQVYAALGDIPPDLDEAATVRGFFAVVQALAGAGEILAYHDRSDGGVFAAVCEMAFASRAAVAVDLPGGSHPLGALFSEELGAVLQVRDERADKVIDVFADAGVQARTIGAVTTGRRLQFAVDGCLLIDEARTDLHRAWSETSYRLKAMRDDPDCAREEYDGLLDEADPGLPAAISFDPSDDPAAPFLRLSRPRVAILREQGVNGQVEMAWAFHAAGFEAVDVHMSELLAGQAQLEDFQGLAAPGGFSYGDVLGAGRGWASTIRHHPELADRFAAFFADQRRFILGVCNGCQMLAALADLIPGADHWPQFARNRSEVFEARTVAVEVLRSSAVLLEGMAGSRLPIVVAHGEGRACYPDSQARDHVQASACLALRYIDPYGGPAQRYPHNPNGSPDGATG